MHDLRIRIPSLGIEMLSAPVGGFSPTGGFYVTKDGFSGWEDSTEPRVESVARPSEHGDFDFEVYQTPRVVPVEGVIVAPTAAQRVHYARTLTSIGAPGDSFEVSVDLFGETTWARARRGMTRVVNAGRRQGLYCATFTWQFVCRDPRRFGEVDEFPAGVPALNWGNFPAWPVFTITGASAPGYTITGPAGRRIVVTRPLVAGTPHVIDTATGGLLIDGVRVQGGVSVWEPWQIDVGLPGVTHTISAGALLVEVTRTFM